MTYRKTQAVPGADIDNAPPADRAIFDHVMNTRKLGFMPSMFAAMGQSPGALDSVASVGEHVRFKCGLDADHKEVIICEVSAIVGNRFEWCHHFHKVPAALQARCGTGALEDEPAPLGPIVRYARTLARGEVNDALTDELRDMLGDTLLVDLTVMIGYYQLLGTFCAALGIEVEDDTPKHPMPLQGT